MVTREGSRPVRAEHGLRKLGFDLMSLPPKIVSPLGGQRGATLSNDGGPTPATDCGRARSSKRCGLPTDSQVLPPLTRCGRRNAIQSAEEDTFMAQLMTASVAAKPETETRPAVNHVAAFAAKAQPADLAPEIRQLDVSSLTKRGTMSSLLSKYRAIRSVTRSLAAPMSAEDQMIQSCPEASPMKWHQAHMSRIPELYGRRRIRAPGVLAFRRMGRGKTGRLAISALLGARSHRRSWLAGLHLEGFATALIAARNSSVPRELL